MLLERLITLPHWFDTLLDLHQLDIYCVPITTTIGPFYKLVRGTAQITRSTELFLQPSLDKLTIPMTLAGLRKLSGIQLIIQCRVTNLMLGYLLASHYHQTNPAEYYVDSLATIRPIMDRLYNNAENSKEIIIGKKVGALLLTAYSALLCALDGPTTRFNLLALTASMDFYTHMGMEQTSEIVDLFHSVSPLTPGKEYYQQRFPWAFLIAKCGSAYQRYQEIITVQRAFRGRKIYDLLKTIQEFINIMHNELQKKLNPSYRASINLVIYKLYYRLCSPALTITDMEQATYAMVHYLQQRFAPTGSKFDKIFAIQQAFRDCVSYLNKATKISFVSYR